MNTLQTRQNHEFETILVPEGKSENTNKQNIKTQKKTENVMQRYVNVHL